MQRGVISSLVCSFDILLHRPHINENRIICYNFRCYVSVAVLDGKIYAMGGFDGHFRQNTAERYTPENNQWSMIQPMHQQRSDANATALNGLYTG